MRYTMLIAAASAAALISGAAFAQNTGSASTANQAPAAGDTAVNPPASATTSGSAGITSPSASGSTDATVAPAAGAPTERAPASDLSNTVIIASPPVPDTPATRKMYKPLSHAGNMSQPAGN
jgi:hypothetical protein